MKKTPRIKNGIPLGICATVTLVSCGRTGAYSADIIHKAALDFIENHQDKPFFMFYPTTIPHAELIAKEEYLALFRGKFDPEKPYSGVDEGPAYRLGPYGSQHEPHAAFAAMIKQLDDYVGEILDLLIDLGIEENTIVIFASDNGPHLEGGADPVYFNSSSVLRGFKRDLYEGGILTPLVVKWPAKIKKGTISGHISAFWDVLPTFADIAGAEVPENIDGISFLPVLLGKKQKQHEYLYWEFHEQGGSQAVRMSRWKAVRLNVNKDHNGELELYDLSKDPGETHNVASSNPEITEKMEDIMNQAHTPSEVFPFSYEPTTINP